MSVTKRLVDVVDRCKLHGNDFPHSLPWMLVNIQKRKCAAEDQGFRKQNEEGSDLPAAKATVVKIST